MRLLARIGIVSGCTFVGALVPVGLLVWLDRNSKLDVFMVDSVHRGDFEPIQIALVALLAAICGGSLCLIPSLHRTRRLTRRS